MLIFRKLSVSQIQDYIFYIQAYVLIINLFCYCNRDCFEKQLWVTGPPRKYPE